MHTTLTPHIRASVDKVLTASLGKPWVPLGRGPNSFDCWGFVLYVYRAAGVEIPDAVLSPVKDVATAAKNGGVVAKQVSARTPYSLVLFGKNGTFGHVGIYHPSGVVYHCLERQGVVGHSPALLSGIFDAVEYWSVTDDVCSVPTEYVGSKQGQPFLRR